MIEQLSHELLNFLIHILEWLGIIIITCTAIQSFIAYIKRAFNCTDDTIKIRLAKSLAVGLEFKLAGEILKTVKVQTFDEIYMLAAIIIVRVVLTFVIHWEIKTDLDHSNQEKA